MENISIFFLSQSLKKITILVTTVRHGIKKVVFNRRCKTGDDGKPSIIDVF